MRLGAFRPTCRSTRCVVRAAAVYLHPPENWERGEFSEFIFGSYWVEYTKYGATFNGVHSGNLRPQAIQGLENANIIIIIDIIMGFSVFWFALEPDGVPLLLTCSACSDCHPTLAQLLPLPKVSHVNLKVVVHGAAGRPSPSPCPSPCPWTGSQGTWSAVSATLLGQWQ